MTYQRQLDDLDPVRPRDRDPDGIADRRELLGVVLSDLGDDPRALFVARMPASVCLNEILISPTWNRGYVGNRQRP